MAPIHQARALDAGEEQEVEEREDPAADHVGDEADDDGAIAVAGEERSEQERQAEAREPEALARLEDRRHGGRRDQAPEEEAWQVAVEDIRHDAFSAAAMAFAALMRPTWV
jgi:hypothetical protein